MAGLKTRLKKVSPSDGPPSGAGEEVAVGVARAGELLLAQERGRPGPDVDHSAAGSRLGLHALPILALGEDRQLNIETMQRVVEREPARTRVRLGPLRAHLPRLIRYASRWAEPAARRRRSGVGSVPQVGANPR